MSEEVPRRSARKTPHPDKENDSSGSAQEQGDDEGYETGHDGLQCFRPRTFLPRVLPERPGGQASAAGPAFPWHDASVSSRSDHEVQYSRPGLAVLLCGIVPLSRAVRQILV